MLGGGNPATVVSVRPLSTPNVKEDERGGAKDHFLEGLSSSLVWFKAISIKIALRFKNFSNSDFWALPKLCEAESQGLGPGICILTISHRETFAPVL